MKMIDTTHHVYNTREEADLQVDFFNRVVDDDWSYIVVADPKGSGRCIIKAYDETGSFVAII